jgi:hypothetical protein
VRGRPLAWVTAKKLVVGASSSYEYIRLQNPGPVGVFIKRVRAYPPIYGIAKDHSAGAITRAVVKFDVNVLLGPSDTHDLVIVPLRDPSKVPKDEPSRWVCFLIYWRKTSSSWLPQVPVPVMTSTHDIQRIAAAAP